MKKLGKYPTRSELKERGITRREHELMYQWFENGCRDYKNMNSEGEETPEGDGVTFKTAKAGGGIGLTNVQ